MNKVQVSEQKPADFQPKVEAVACYLEVNQRLLLIQQAAGRTDEGLWGVPAGKIEQNETPQAAARRELFEETGIEISSPAQIVHLRTLYIRKRELDYVYYMFKIHLDKMPAIRLSHEHHNYLWADGEGLKKLPLRPGVKGALEYYQRELKIDFRFAHAKPSQREMIHQWLNQKHNKEWIHGVGLQNTLSGIEKFFQGKSNTTYWIGYDQETPFAFLITSPEGTDAITLDLFICDLNYLGKGIAASMIRSFLMAHFSNVKRVLIDPEKTNARAIHVYEKVGFKIIGEFTASWHPVPHCQMELLMKDLDK